MRYLQIQVKGYKSLADVTLDLHPLTVMIGPNGCGKTSLLEVFRLSKEGSMGQLATAITNLGGFNSIVSHFPGMSSRIEFVLKLDDLSQNLASMSYTYALEPYALGHAVALERLQWHRLNDDAPVPEFEDRGLPELMLAQSFLWDADPEPKVLREMINRTATFGPLDTDVRAPIRLPQSLVPASQPGRNGETLFATLYNLRESQEFRSCYGRIEETLHLAFSDFEHLELPVVGSGQITLAWHQKGLTVPLYPNQLSEGTLRFLWLTATLLSPEPPPLILIDEPEVSLHPELQKILAGLLQDASARTQVLVATHSPELIRWLEPGEVVIIDKAEGQSKFTWADDPSLDLVAWLKEYTLADLWDMGNLGGRP